MKKKLIKLTVGIVLALSMTINVLAAVQWSGSKDVQEAKDKIVTITDLFRRKNETISGLKETNKNNESVIRDKDKTIADKEKAILDKEKAIREKEQVIVQLEDRISEKERVIAQLEKGLDNMSSKHKEELEQAKKDVKELNKLLGDVVEENK